MNKSDLKKYLIDTGLSKKEAEVYLCILNMGKGKVSEIARSAKLNRTTGYVILDLLTQKGLVSISGKKPRAEYAAESPDKLIDFLEKKNTQIQKLLSLGGPIVASLKSIHNVRGRPSIRFYEGKDGLKYVYEDTLTSSEDIRAIASVEDTQKTLPGYFPKYYQRRANKRIGIRAIFPKTPEALELIKRNEEERRESALVPREQYGFSPEINIYDNKIIIASWLERLGVIIESPEIADAMKKLFDLAWEEARRLNNRIE